MLKRKFRVTHILLSIFGLLCVGIFFYLFMVMSALNSRPEREISIKDVYPFLEEGKVFSLAEVYPFEWTEVEIANACGGRGDFYADLLEFDPNFSAWHDIHFLMIFYQDGKVIEYFQYLRNADTIFPVFGEKHYIELGWHKRIQREQARFFWDGIQGKDGEVICILVPDQG